MVSSLIFLSPEKKESPRNDIDNTNDNSKLESTEEKKSDNGGGSQSGENKDEKQDNTTS